MKTSLLCGALMACGWLLPAYAAQNDITAYVKRPIAAVRTTTPPVIDGDLSDSAWKDAPRAETFIDRQRSLIAQDPTFAYILYDDRFIYVAFHCLDSRPDQIVGRETVRDHKYRNEEDDEGEDNIEVLFDTFRTTKWDDFSVFSVNPLGTRSARIGGGRANKAEWKGDWDAAAKRVADGWACEMRIPWSILNYPASKAPLTMGINFQRWQQRTRIHYVWSNIGPSFFNELEGLWTGVQVPASAFRPKLSLLPYLLPNPKRGESSLRTGLDARYTLTPQMTMVGSINPDFATIEGAVEGIFFSRSERYIPERRPFFLEGEDFFGAGLGGPLFYPNRIETFDVGTKVYGRLTPKDSLGVLHTLDYNRRSDLVARYEHDLSPTSDISVFLMNKDARDDQNTVASVGQFMRRGKFGFGTQFGITAGREAGGAAKSVTMIYEDKRNFTYLGYQDIAPRFRVADGLVFFTDIRGFEMFHDWGGEWRRGAWRNFHIGGGGTYNWHTNGKPFQRGFGLNTGIASRSDWGFGLDFNYQRFEDQTDRVYGLFVGHGLSNRFRKWGLNLSTGSLGGRPSTSIGPGFSLRTFRKFDVSYGGTLMNLDGHQEQHILTLNYELSPSRSLGGRVVVQNADTNWYLSYRHSGERGTEVYFIVGDPNTRRFAEQALIKLVFAL